MSLDFLLLTQGGEGEPLAIAIRLDRIATIRELFESEREQRTVPASSRTVITLVNGFFYYVKETIDVVFERIREVADEA